MSKKSKHKDNRIVPPGIYLGKMKLGPVDAGEREQARLADLRRKIDEREQRLRKEAETSTRKLATPMSEDMYADWERLKTKYPVLDRTTNTNPAAKPAVRAQAASVPAAGNRRLYFAYGSNLMKSQMKQRCSGAVALYPLNLTGFKLEFQRHANIVEAGEADSVPGAVYLITPEDEEWLDKYEGVGHGAYVKKTFRFFTPKGNWRNVLYYQKAAGPVVPPTNSYLQRIVAGYKDFQLDFNKLNVAIDEANKADALGTAMNGWTSAQEEQTANDLYALLDDMGLKVTAANLQQLIDDDAEWHWTPIEKAALRRKITMVKARKAARNEEEE